MLCQTALDLQCIFFKVALTQLSVLTTSDDQNYHVMRITRSQDRLLWIQWVRALTHKQEYELGELPLDFNDNQGEGMTLFHRSLHLFKILNY